MLRSTSSQNNPSNPSAPHGNASNSSASQAAVAEKQTKAKIAKLESIHAKNAAVIKQFNDASNQKESYQFQLNSHNKDLIAHHQESQPVIKHVIDSNMAKILAPSTSTTQTLNGPINNIVLAKLMTTDPALIPLGNQLKTISENIHQEEKNINNVQKKIDILSQKKDSLKKDLEKSKIELEKSIDALLATKAGAANELEIDHLLSVAHQKIAAADFLQSGDRLAQAERTFSSTEQSLFDASKKADQIFVQVSLNQRAFNAAQDGFIKKSGFLEISADQQQYQAAFLADPENIALANAVMASLAQVRPASIAKQTIAGQHEQARIDLIQAKSDFQLAESTLKKSNSAVADAKSALDRPIFANTLTDVEEDAPSTVATPHPATDDSAGIDMNGLADEVIATGVPHPVDIL